MPTVLQCTITATVTMNHGKEDSLQLTRLETGLTGMRIVRIILLIWWICGGLSASDDADTSFAFIIDYLIERIIKGGSLGVCVAGQFNIVGFRMSISGELRYFRNPNSKDGTKNAVKFSFTYATGEPSSAVKSEYDYKEVVLLSTYGTGLEADVGLNFLISNADEPEQLEGKGVTSGFAGGWVPIGAAIDVSTPLKPGAFDAIENSSGDEITEYSINISPITPGWTYGVEVHFRHSTNTKRWDIEW